MIFNKQLYKLALVLCLVMIGTVSISADTAEVDAAKKKKKKRKPTTALTVKSVSVKQSNKETIDMVTAMGDQISLPKVEKEFTETPLASPLYAGVLDSEVSDFSSQSLMLRLAEMDEMAKLSKRLGIEIKDSKHLELYREVAGWLGTRYRRGGMNRNAVDCSGFTGLIYSEVFDKKIPRVSTEIARTVPHKVDKEDLKPGDLVFFSTFGRKHINHVGVYLGSGNFAHASIKKGVIVSNLRDGYYSKAWRKGGRLD